MMTMMTPGMALSIREAFLFASPLRRPSPVHEDAVRSTMSLMLQRFREWLSLALMVLLPFHAFAITVLTKLITGPGHAPLSSIAIWKEILLGVIILLAGVEILLRTKESRKWGKVDSIDGVIIALMILAFVISGLQSPFSLFNTLFGFKYDFFPMLALLVLRRVPWSPWFRDRAPRCILWVGAVVSLYGIATFFLPDSFFYWLGYSDLHSLYVAKQPIAAFQQIGGTSLRRIQSTFSGPNQFGVWLLLPIGIALRYELRALNLVQKSIVHIVCRLPLLALLLTFCRAAWIGVFGMILFSLYPWIKPRITRGRFLASIFLFGLLLFGALVSFPDTLLRLSSTRGHIERPIQALQKMVAHPFGLGLGSAGPTTNRSSDTCVMLRPEDDPEWAEAHPNLCVFLGDTQVQPTNRACLCPFLPESWYLQIGVELGWIGLFLYLCLMVFLFRRLYALRIENGHWIQMSDHTRFYLRNSVFYIFFAVSIAAFFLHAWEDSSIAYTVWVLMAIALEI